MVFLWSLFVCMCRYTLFLFVLPPSCPSLCSLNLMLSTLNKTWGWRACGGPRVEVSPVLSHCVEVSRAVRWAAGPFPHRAISLSLSTAFLIFKNCVYYCVYIWNVDMRIQTHVWRWGDSFEEMKFSFSWDPRMEIRVPGILGKGFACWTKYLLGAFITSFENSLFSLLAHLLIGWFAYLASFRALCCSSILDINPLVCGWQRFLNLL